MPDFSSNETKGDAEMKDRQARRAPDRYSRGNYISSPEKMKWVI
jgi:hypothetical protein